MKPLSIKCLPVGVTGSFLVKVQKVANTKRSAQTFWLAGVTIHSPALVTEGSGWQVLGDHWPSSLISRERTEARDGPLWAQCWAETLPVSSTWAPKPEAELCHLESALQTPWACSPHHTAFC